ncbi:histidine kinase, partial [aff. Roholtiella sp. LEGE 12411]|nr:histidine kinase [aff. Roholtiella sp. LEGE 12411]
MGIRANSIIFHLNTTPPMPNPQCPMPNAQCPM